MRIAITSQNFRTITGHAGKTRRFLVFEGVPGGEPREAERIDLPKEMAFHEFCGRAHPIDGCEVLVTQGAGLGFRQRLAQRGIRVIVTGESDPLKAARACISGEPLPEPVPDADAHHHHGHDDGHHHGGCGCSGEHD